VELLPLPVLWPAGRGCLSCLRGLCFAGAAVITAACGTVACGLACGAVRNFRVPKLKGILESKQSLRLKPVLRGTMERRSRLEAALRECEFRVAQRGSPRRKVEAIPDLCDESLILSRRSGPGPD
jgi:hypothetical protein